MSCSGWWLFKGVVEWDLVGRVWSGGSVGVDEEVKGGRVYKVGIVFNV